MKKIISAVIAVFMLTGLCTGCAGEKGGTAPKTSANDEGLRIVTTIFPLYDWTRQILGETSGDGELTLLAGGSDMHSYQPTTEDIVKIANCDVFLYIGGESDTWVDEALKNIGGQEVVAINLLDVLADMAKEEEHKEGMTTGEDENPPTDSHEPETDEHLWLSLRCADTACAYIAKALGEIDPENAAAYEQNANAYEEKLRQLDERYKAAVQKAPHKTLVVGDRFALRYLVEDYDLEYFAAFPGCSAETEASFNTIVFLAGKMDELGLANILAIESSDGSIAKTIAQNTKEKDKQVVVFNTLQSATGKEIAGGITYLGVMEENLDILAKALQ